jgi:hypothetical protein
MDLFKRTMAGAIVVSMMTATGAAAAMPTRSAQAMPIAQTAPVSGVRSATALRNASSQSDGDSPAAGYILAAIVGAGIIAAVIEGTDNHSDARPVSAG